MRVKGGITRSRRHKKILKATKGYRMSRHLLYRTAHQAFMHAGQYAYSHRQKRAGDMRRVWIAKINAACKLNNIQYKDFINKLKVNNINLNRMVLADIAQNNPEVFATLVQSL